MKKDPRICRTRGCENIGVFNVNARGGNKVETKDGEVQEGSPYVPKKCGTCYEAFKARNLSYKKKKGEH